MRNLKPNEIIDQMDGDKARDWIMVLERLVKAKDDLIFEELLNKAKQQPNMIFRIE